MAPIPGLKGHSLEASIESLVSLLKRRQISGPEPCAIATAHILLQVVAKSKWSDVDTLLERVQDVGRKLVLARPQELVIGNIVRRVLGLIRDEAEEDRAGNGDDSMSDISMLPGDEMQQSSNSAPISPLVRPPTRMPTLTSTGSFHVPQSMFNLLQDLPRFGGSSLGSPFAKNSGTSTPMSHAQVANISALRSEVIEGIEELKDEISSVDEQISSYAEVQIHPGQYVLVHKPNATVEKFLLAAAKRRKFTVLIAGAEIAKYADQVPHAALRKQLIKFGVNSIVIAGNGIMAYMPKVHTVVLNSQAITANGAVIADGGAAIVARAAREYNKTVIVLGAVYKLCPEDEPDLDALVDVGNPQSLTTYDGQMVDVDVEAVASEYIMPELVDLYISNLGPHCRDHLQGIVGDHYKIEDVDFIAQ
ncbi:initiation factor 2 subunit family protein [Coniella lustricola]|uniref:Translation initiation factor eIF2B subunit beta n=1 Tax=Coniella lustricola TaxID=2025994 RepID=A0A2T3AI14_9PEZI|nr:initiation factor 2 subunit family protein [Coniella lustricola]